MLCVVLLNLVGLTAVPPLTFREITIAAFFAMLWALPGYAFAYRRVILYEDAIEVCGLFSCRRLNLTEILGRQIQEGRSDSYYVIVPTDSTKGQLRFPAFLHVDREFHSWIRKIPRLSR